MIWKSSVPCVVIVLCMFWGVQICFMVNHGLDVEFHAAAEAIHWLIDGCDEERDGSDVVAALNFLVEESGMPPDAQVAKAAGVIDNERRPVASIVSVLPATYVYLLLRGTSPLAVSRRRKY